MLSILERFRREVVGGLPMVAVVILAGALASVAWLSAGCNGSEGPHCGDGLVNVDGEECDQGSQNSDTEPDACRTDCTRSRCGDGVIDTNEECDDGALNSDTEPGACRMDCVAAHCGDGWCDLDEDWNTCDGDCPGVGAPCQPDDPNACAGVAAAGLDAECIEVLTDASNNEYDFAGGYCSATCDRANDICDSAGGVCEHLWGNRAICLLPCDPSIQPTDCRPEQEYQCCRTAFSTAYYCISDSFDCFG